MRDLGQRQQRERRLLVRLHDDAVACSESRAELPDRQQQREVPGHDAGDDPDRLAPHRPDCQAGAADLRPRSLEPTGPRELGEVPEPHERGADVQRAGLTNGDPALGDLERHEVLDPLLEPGRDRVEDVGPLGWLLRSPNRFPMRPCRRLHSAIGVLDAAARDRRHHLLGGRVDDLKALTGVDPLAADVHQAVRTEIRGGHPHSQAAWCSGGLSAVDKSAPSHWWPSMCRPGARGRASRHVL